MEQKCALSPVQPQSGAANQQARLVWGPLGRLAYYWWTQVSPGTAPPPLHAWFLWTPGGHRIQSRVNPLQQSQRRHVGYSVDSFKVWLSPEKPVLAAFCLCRASRTLAGDAGPGCCSTDCSVPWCPGVTHIPCGPPHWGGDHWLQDSCGPVLCIWSCGAANSARMLHG